MRYLASEETVSLEVAVPPTDVRIVDYSYPSEAESKSTITVSFTVRNDGGAASCYARLVDRDTGEEVAVDTFYLEYGQSYSGSLRATMPTRDWNLRLEVGWYELIGVTGVMAEVRRYPTDYRDFTISVIVPTDIALGVEPASVEWDQTVRVYGGLYRADTGAGLAGMTVTIDLTSLGLGTVDVTTASDGSFEYTFTCPHVSAGSYTIKASFAGATVAGVTYAPSTAKAGLGVMAVGVPTWLPIAAPLMAGAVLVAVTLARR